MMNQSIFIVLLIGGLLVIISCETVPIIESISPEQVKDIGDSAILNCTVDNPDNYTVIWTRKVRDRPTDNVVLTIGSSLTMKDAKFELIITNNSKSYLLNIHKIQALDSAIYECQIIISAQKKITSQVELLVRTPPKISDSLTTVPASTPVGGSAQLKCIADGYPKPTVSWKREYDAILPNGGSSLSGNFLNINDVTRQDRGTYYCIAENNAGKPDRKSLNFEVEFRPVITAPRPKVAQAVDYSIELECKIEAYPAPAIGWYKDSIPIRNEGDYSISNTATVDEITYSVLRIDTIDTSQYGDYYCKASNKVGHAETRINLFESFMPVHPWQVSGRDE